MFSSYSEESHIYDKYLGLLPFFDFDGALNPYQHELCSLSTVYPSSSNCNSHEVKTCTKVVGLLVPSASASTYYVGLATQTFEVLKHSEHMHL